MTKNAAKDFGPIADDYAFFEQQSTEAESDARAYVAEIGTLAHATSTVRMLDFGCGSGRFTARFLDTIGWRPEQVRLTLVEPVEAWRRETVARLTSAGVAPAAEHPSLPQDLADRFDLTLSNHVLYYVTDLKVQLAGLIGLLADGGVFVTAIAGRSNALIEFWIEGFKNLGREVPYHMSEDVEAALRSLGTNYSKRQVPYELVFPDSQENRMRILRFLLADHLATMPVDRLSQLFDKYRDADEIRIQTTSDHYAIRV